ncbi:transposase [Paenibacillus macerans]|uniref:transposase n=1 Tax=Paenibacillus macerans TaxID=44252 RepID=UPI00227EF20C|nr:transposase [Paenibacillus macerans]MCY7557516.1 transposase [Paenibacillus macerans]
MQEWNFNHSAARYNSEQACIEALIAMKWPSGFVCPRCAHTRCSSLASRHIPLFECGKCKHQTSPLVGTIFEGTRLRLPGAEETMRQKLLRMCVAIPAIPYRRLIARQSNQPRAAVA